jgi:hypothetical protein
VAAEEGTACPFKVPSSARENLGKIEKIFRKSLNYNPLIAILASISGHAINAPYDQRIFKILDN